LILSTVSEREAAGKEETLQTRVKKLHLPVPAGFPDLVRKDSAGPVNCAKPKHFSRTANGRE
jgi:hypothetical protein